ERAMQISAEKIAAGQRVGVLFGPERAGLENDDIARANAIINVPVNPEFPSLNLAQCVLLTAYEWRRATQEANSERTEMAQADWASHADVENLSMHYEDTLTQAGFFFPDTKAANMKTNLRNMWSRMPLTRADVQMLHGVLRQMVRWKER
ncbi:MAG: TrmH family RNA methyltransferase, partial [Pseudomonadota bacterium]